MAASLTYRDTHKNSSESDSDSDKESSDWKRASKPVKNHSESVSQTGINLVQEAKPCQNGQSAPIAGQKRKRNTIWSDVLEEQIVSETLGHCLLKNKPKGYGSRGEESYDYTLSYQDKRNRRDFDEQMSTDEMTDDSDKGSVVSSESREVRKNSKYVKLDQAGTEAAKKIVKTLNEKKAYLIFRVVKVVGIEKAVALLKMTEQIEESGGMMIKNNARRRTPGGVYFQLLKSDKDITKEMVDKIFECELSHLEFKNKANKKKFRKKQQSKKSKAKQENDMVVDPPIKDEEAEQIDKSIPPIEVVKEQGHSDFEEGEIED